MAARDDIRPERHEQPTYADEVRAQLRVRCVHLVTKEAFVGVPSEHEQAFEADGPIWWCDRTSEAMGPDGCAADESCHAPCNRTCFEPPVRP